MNQDKSGVQLAAHLLYQARYAVALTGAGISTPSGIPDFRSPESGLWEQINPLEVISIHAFRYSPETFYTQLQPLARKILAAQPNLAHRALAQLEKMGCIKCIITQNIDSLHQQAGCQRVLEIHGHLREAVCIRCYTAYPSKPFIEEFISSGQAPHCPQCSGPLKPSAILYGEQLPIQVLSQARQEVEKCDMLLVVGSSLEVSPAAELPLCAYQHGAGLIIINLQPTYLDHLAHPILPTDAAAVLPEIVSIYQNLMESNYE